MSTLDRYIARQYLINVVVLLVLLFSFVVMVDVALNIHSFSEAADKLSSVSGGHPSALRRVLLTALWIADLWWPRLLQLFVFLLGLVLTGAMGFTLAQLVRHRELVAMLSGGISLRRIARPILLVALGMTALQVLDQELVIPRIAHLLTRDHSDAGDRSVKDFQVLLTPDGQRRVFYAGKFEPDAGVMIGVRIWERDADDRATRQITADRAVWRDGGWDLVEPRVSSLALAAQGSREAPRPSPAPDGSSGAGPTRIETDLDPTTLLVRNYPNYSHSLSWRQISSMVGQPNLNPSIRDKLDAVRFGRISSILSNLLSLVIVLPFFLLREPANMVIQSLKGAPVGIISLMGGVLGAAATIPGLPPALGVFLPVLVLAPIAIATTASVRT